MSAVTSASVRQYWDAHIHDLDISTHEAGTPGFFADLDAYHFEKLHHLLRLVDFDAWRGRPVLDVGCGAGVEVVRFARGGARVVGVDISKQATELSQQNLGHQRLSAPLAVAGGETLPFRDDTFDFVYAHGVIQYAADDRRVVSECHRVLRPGGLALFQVYNRVSWLHLLSNVMRVPLEHEDAPVLRRYSIGEFRTLLGSVLDGRDYPGALSRQESAAQGMERHPLQRRLRGPVQCSPARMGPPIWLAPHRALPEIGPVT